MTPTNATADPDAGDPLLAAAAAERAQRLVEADNLVKRHVAVAVTFALVPVPLFDLALLTGNLYALARALAGHYGVPFAPRRLHAALIALLGGAVPVAGVAGLAASELLPGVGILAGGSAVALVGGALTYAVGRVLGAHFAAGGDLCDFDPRRWRRRFAREVTAGGKVVAQLRAPAAGAH